MNARFNYREDVNSPWNKYRVPSERTWQYMVALAETGRENLFGATWSVFNEILDQSEGEAPML